ncbi:MAG: type VI-D CRISPR-associated RNA-guided ribonuclease Cas13d [Monoglobaceae bacterium]
MNNSFEISNIFDEKTYKPLKPKSKKAKAAGLKSTFVVEDDILMTSFGKGNNAVLEKKITGGEIENINKDIKFDVNPDGDHYNIKGNGIRSNAYTAKGSVKPVGADLIGCKERLEKRYFGQTFNDNIHIQLVYNILDIEKILTVHINDIVYSLDNLQRKDGFEDDDFIGYMSTRNSYDVFCNPRIEYADNAEKCKKISKLHDTFEKYKKNSRLAYYDCITYDKKKNVDEKKLYYMLAILGEIRQFCAHSDNVDKLYNFEKNLPEEARIVLDQLYESKISSVNRGFVKNNDKNICILFDVLGICGNAEKIEIIKSFYDFVIRKSFKNIGFSIKRLREQMIELNDADIKSGRYDSVRSKFYTLLDFIIYTYYKNNKACADNNLNALRSCVSDEEKEIFYTKEANRLWNEVQNVCSRLKYKMNGKYISEIVPEKSDADLLEKVTKEVALKKDTNYFCKIIYLMTLFLDGKEINDLLTTLINKFENIASFMDVMDKCNITYNFKCNSEVNFKMFNDAKKIAWDLRAINSFARMSSTSVNAKRVLYIEAAQLLGVEEEEGELIDYLQDRLLGEHIPKGRHGFRNFIASNVIESSRFKYLVRYANPKKVRAVANNKKVVKFVLEKMPDTQIDRYYKSCTGRNRSRAEQIETLADIIQKVNFKDFENVEMKVRRHTPEEDDKKQKQAVISLYLTVLYLLVKNLVYVNSRYFLAFHCYERDARLLKVSDYKKGRLNLTAQSVARQKEDINKWYNSLENPTRNQKQRKYRIERSCSYLETNMANIDEKTVNLYRNNVDHLNPIRNIDLFINDVKKFGSYFELYHYLMQRSIVKSAEHFGESLTHPKVQEYIRDVETYGAYSKDFVKALNSPFGYNLPRFKNLSVDALFDMHNPPMIPERETKKD